ncbi:methyltransferase [Catenulispora sp. NF23]|uniref:Methyltransferase n=1 Tax=Catenulispora pinistramenti TaxID=2705254 RepID=A0ABS5KIX0_9ACTN|nr:methyltransferase [Catenulispora pinistramenti]MBS2538687.1 methyltransferase [Catenulispora pinistramenti]MBS2545840.1 methyltransferase [Catenulispora pinistramenti]
MADSAASATAAPAASAGSAGPGPAPARRGQARTAVLWQAVSAVLDAPTPRDVLDVGGGTGGFAVPIAELGHRVTVVDPSPDALAALERRAAEAGVPKDALRAVQGDLAGLLEHVEPGSVDLVLCHGVLEMADDPAVGLAVVADVLRPGGVVSVLAANRTAAVVARALGGHFAEARRALADPRGRFGAQDPLAARFDEEQLSRLLADAGLTVQSVHGVRVFTDLVPGALVDTEPHGAADLAALEAAVADRPEFRAVAGRLHLLARKIAS